ncbi:4'-phosphopantetheinyl transferase superfamily protein [uncultured Roseobacter sp.]|uniref:4'-phosphopantetheinyl transferase family protein n=1 Tax=uncultured Roseobacter sp. TaxID=114847 RepID=UPI002616022A|nr:4'-phosphopantetheinyl transferase superfamily protein [uncultured Roseobacter sp.]
MGENSTLSRTAHGKDRETDQPGRTVDIWHVDLSRICGKVLSHPYLNQSDRLATAGRADRAATRVALRMLLGHITHLPASELRFCAGPFGKPALQHSDLVFSVSRRESTALIAVSQGAEIGLDFEIRRPVPELFGIARMFHPAERQLLSHVPASERLDWFYRIWTRKEAVLKAIGTGLSVPLDSFCVVGAETGKEPVRMRNPRSPEFYLQELVLENGQFACLASPDPDITPRMHRFWFPEQAG